MSSLIISGDTSGTVTLAAPAVAGSNTLTLQAGTATNSMNTLSTAVASTSGTSIDFTALPSWIKRITVMFTGVSTSGTSTVQIQLGTSSGIDSSSYAGSMSTGGVTVYSSTAFLIASTAAAAVTHGIITLSTIGSNVWVISSSIGGTASYEVRVSGGSKTLSGTLDRVRITTVNGTDTFDAGSINILYEG
jgi:hypothetical protein